MTTPYDTTPMTAVRLITYQGSTSWVRGTLERSFPDGSPMHGITVQTLDGPQLADLATRHPDWPLDVLGRAVTPGCPPAACRVIPADLLDDIRTTLDRYTDVVEGGDGKQYPNAAMRVLADLDRVLGGR